MKFLVFFLLCIACGTNKPIVQPQTLTAEITPWYGGAPNAASGYDILISGTTNLKELNFLKAFYKGYAADLETETTPSEIKLKARILIKTKTNQQMHADAIEEYGNEYPEALRDKFTDDQLAITYRDGKKNYVVIIENTSIKQPIYYPQAKPVHE